MIRRPPISPLFPYTPLSRSAPPGRAPASTRSASPRTTASLWPPPPPRPSRSGTSSSAGGRSEEHTSELQSQSNLVCRLLLEKKKKETENAQVPAAQANHTWL